MSKFISDAMEIAEPTVVWDYREFKVNFITNLYIYSICN